MNNKEKYNEVFINSFEMDSTCNPSEAKRGVTPNWDSLGHMILMGNIEDTFDIMMDTDDILMFDSYAKGIEILKKYEVEL